MNYLVFDIGGTYTRQVFFRGNRICEEEEYKTIKNKKILVDLVKRVKLIQNKYSLKKLDGIAISAPGYLDAKKFKLVAPVNLIKIKNLSLAGLKKYCKKLRVENDANCAALGALENEKVKNLVCLTLGTGLGAGIIIDKKLYTGSGVASEYGHTTVDINDGKCNCGNFGCLENYVSTRGLLNIARKKGIKGDTFKIYKLARLGDKKALEVYEDYGKLVGVALINISNILDPEVVVLTGGLINPSKFWLKYALKEAEKRLFSGIFPRVKVYKENLSVIGALNLLK